MIARSKFADLIKLSFLLIFVFSFSLAKGARIFFNDIYKGTGSNYAEQTNSISNIQFITGSGFTFTSSDPADVTFRLTGNNVAGTLSYLDAFGVKQSIIGQVSRQDKASGNNTKGFYFFTNTNEAYLLVIPGITTYSAGTDVSTSSDNQFLNAMNTVLSNQNSQPKISVSDVTVNNTDSYAVFTVSLSSAANANSTFTPTLTANTATLNTDYTSSMQYYNGSSWVNITSTVTIAQGATSIQIRVPILNAGAASSRTFNLNTGTVTGSNVLNSDGAFGLGTILPAPNITVTGSLKIIASCSGCSVNPQSFTVSGVNLTNNIVLTAPLGVQISTNSNSGYTSNITLNQVSNTVTTTAIYTQLTNNATTASSGTISITSTGAISRTITVTVRTDNALNFDGVDDKVTIADNNVLDLTTNYTIEAWIRPTSFTFLGGIVSKYHSAASNGYLLRLTGSGDYSGISFDEMNTANGVLSLNKWNHIAAVNNNGTRKLYINGVEQVLTGIPLTTAANSDPVIIGQDFSSNGGRFFKGSIDEVRIWNSARTLTQINDNLTNSLAGNETGLVAYYKFDAGNINGNNTNIPSLGDFTTNALTGTLSGFALTGSTSNFVAGFIPEITAAGNATSVVQGNTLQLSNGLSGGTWSSSASGVATINSSGLVTGVAAGSVTMTYTICSKTVSYNLTVVVPTLTTSSLKTFTSCSGCAIEPQKFTVSGSNLGANVTVTAPTGFVISTTSTGTYVTSLTFTPTSGTLNSTDVFAKLQNTATTGTTGNFTVASTGATSKTVTATVNTDNALNFDGGNDVVTTASNISTLNITGDITLETWIRLTQIPTDYVRLIGKGSPTERTYGLWIYSDGSLLFQQFTSSGVQNLITNSSLIEAGKWYHIAASKIGTNVKIFINGSEVANSNSFIYTPYSSNAPLEIGGTTSIHRLLNGSMDEVRIWNIGRSSSEISNNYLKELTGAESGLVAYYNFNHGTVNGNNSSIPSITTLVDRTSNAINGTITNFALSGSTSNFVAGFMPEITGATSLQKTSTTTYTNNLTGGTWSSSATGVATVDASGVITGVAAGTSTITYTICEKTVSKVITIVEPTITTSGALTAFTACEGNVSASQSFTVTASNLTANLVLTAPTGYELSTSSSGTYSTTLIIVPSSGSVSSRAIFVRLASTAVNGVSGNIAATSTGAVTKNVATGNATVNHSLTASVTISSNATNNTFCSGTSVTFTATPTNGGNSPTYQWRVNGVNVSGATSPTFTTNTLSNNSTVTVVMVSSIATCLSGSPATSNTITVTVNSIPSAPASITGPTTICLNSNQVYSVSAVPGATSYSWVVTGDLTATVSTNNVLNITAASTAGSGTIKVLASNACGSSLYSATLSVTVNNTPAPTANITPSASNVCLSSPSVTFVNSSVANGGSTITAYSWDFGDGSTLVSTANASRTYTASGTYDVVMTVTSSNQCTSSISSRIIVDPVSVAGTASAANATICENTSTILTLSGSTGAIQWQSSTNGSTWGNISGATNATYTTANLSVTTYYRAVVTSGACSSATSGVITVTVSPAPTVTLSSVANVYTNATSFDLSYSNPVGGPNEYSITATSPNAMPNFTNINGYGLLGSPITVNMPASAVGTYNFNLVVQNNNFGCNSANIPFTVTVDVLPPSSLSYNTPNVYTVGSTITALNPTSTGGPITQYTIGPSLPAGLTINPTTGVISGTPSAVSSQTTYTVTGTNASGTVTATVVITVNGQPPLSLSYNTPNVYTTGTTISALNPTSSGGTITQYTIGPSLPTGLTINPTTGVISGTPSAVSSQTSYTVTGTNASGTVTTTVVITVNGLPPASLAYNTPNTYTAGTTITALNPTSTGGTITQYTIGPSLPSGLSINQNTGVISGTPTVASAQTTYTVTGTNAYGSVTATLVITVNSGQVVLPQGGINAVDYKLFATDTVKLKINISAGTAPYTVILSNNTYTSKDTLTNVSNGDVVNLKSVSKNTTYTLFKITDNGGTSRTTAFTKDTTAVNIVAPNIALTLKADKAVKQTDNSFKTKLFLKIKNSGQIDLKNVQVNANLSNVFPVGITYKLDSVKVVNGNIRLSNNYQGNGSSTSPSSVKKGIIATSGIRSNAQLDANYLLDNGVNLAINEEADVEFYLSIAPTVQAVTLKLQFSSAGDGLLPKAGGFISQKSSTAISDDGTNIAAHPNNTSIGTPAPTYLPLFPVEIIGASLKASNPTPVTGGYTFDFIAKAKNYSNMNLDTVAIFNDFRKTFINPDTAYIIGTPVVTGNARFNNNFNGYSDTLLIDSTAKLVVGDSITVSYTLFVGTIKNSGSWSNSIYASGHATIDYNYVWDISNDGINPDPNGDGDTKEQSKTYFYINYTPPLPPTVENKTYTFGTSIPPTIAGLVKSYPIGTIPVWCDVQTLLCSPTAPPTPTIIGKYVYQLKSYDTTTKLYSIAFVNDTVIIRPPVPIVNDSTYIIGLANNPANISVQVKAMTGGVLKYFFKANLLSTIPVLGNVPATTSYTVSQVVNQIESDTASFKVTMLLPNDILHLQKIAGDAQLQSNSSFNIRFTFIARNVLNKQLDSVLITDNLMNAVSLPNTFNIISISSTGGLIANTNFNGKTDINLTQYSSKLSANAIDTIKLVINVMPNGFNGALQNTAIANAKTPYGKLSINSTSKAYAANETTKYPTIFTIPDLRIDIPEGFSPNRDGVNDYFVIIKPYGTILDLEVYNRWGNVVYSNANYNNEWDGRGTNNFIGQDLMDGGYYYTLKAKSANGTVQIFKGFVLIQR